MKVSPAFSKAAGCRGRAPARAPQSAELSFMLIKDQEGGLRGKPYQGVSPFYFTLLRVRRFLGRGSLPPAAFSTPFLWCLPKETVSSRQRKAPFYPGGSTIRVSATSRWTGRSSPDFGEGLVGVGALYVCAVFLGNRPRWPCPFHPISLLLRKETGWSPKETRFWAPPRDMFGPTRLSHELEAPTSPPTSST